jgi:DNA-binding transcriptional ArsR family regulator
MNEPDITIISSMLGEPARAKMMLALLSGKALTAGELSIDADITAQTASSHLAKLLNAGLISVEKQGRHKYFRLANEDIAHILEQLLVLSSTDTNSCNRIQTGPKQPELRAARVCYDHLAGEVGVALFEHLKQQELIEIIHGHPQLTATGITLFTQLGADIDSMVKKKRPVCKHCLDWSERKHHLAGSLGQWVLNIILDNGWAKRLPGSRAIIFSTTGKDKLFKQLSSHNKNY